MATTCQHCGATTADDARVMCPSCGRRMQPARSAQANQPPQQTPEPEPEAPAPAPAPAPAYAPGPPYAAGPPYASASPYAPSGSPDADLPPHVAVELRRDAIARTSRVTVLFRLLLAVPHLIVLYGLSVAAAVVTIVVWFAALFTARVPAGLYGFVSWVVSYATRVGAYLFFLTDRWPTFADTDDDPVRVRLPGSLRLNRAAVLFRLILVIPAAVLADLVATGLAVTSVVAWLVVLVMGRVPQPLFDATASSLRYQARYYAYTAMLTARYPGGLFGDPDDPRDGSATTADAPPTPPAVTRGARRLLVVILILGLAGAAGQVARAASLSDQSAKARTAAHDVAADYRTLHVTSDSTCIGSSDELGCLQRTAAANEGEMRTFLARLGAVDFPDDGSIRDRVDDLRFTLQVFADDLDAMSKAASVDAYQQVVQDHNVEQAGSAVDTAVHDLVTALDDYRNGGGP